MKRLFILDQKDYDEKAERYIRPSVRAIIIKDGKVAMVHSLKYDYYKFPGGGIEENESYYEALIREVKEESGLVVMPDTIKEFGSVLRIQKGNYGGKEVFEQENYYYTCEIEDEVVLQNLDEYEADERFKLEYVTPQHAIEVNRNENHGPKDQIMIEREARILELLIEEK